MCFQNSCGFDPSVAVGLQAGNSCQGSLAVAIGASAGSGNQSFQRRRGFRGRV
jgi:hypothetical protein